MRDIILFTHNNLRTDATIRSIEMFGLEDIGKITKIRNDPSTFNTEFYYSLFSGDSQYVQLFSDYEIMIKPLNLSYPEYLNDPDVISVNYTANDIPEKTLWRDDCPPISTPINLKGSIYKKNDLLWLFSGRVVNSALEILSMNQWLIENTNYKSYTYIAGQSVITLRSNREGDISGKRIKLDMFMFNDYDDPEVVVKEYPLEWEK